MFIEIAELLRCPQDHDESFCVISPDQMVGRRVKSGVIGCPVCQAEYPIDQFTASFGDASPAAVAAFDQPSKGDGQASSDTDPAVVQALLNLSGPGGNVVLVGTATLLAAGLMDAMAGIHYIGVNAPADVRPSPGLTLLVAPAGIPLRTSSMRGIVLGEEYADEIWSLHATRVLLRGMRLVALAELEAPRGIEQLAREGGMFVGERV